MKKLIRSKILEQSLLLLISFFIPVFLFAQTGQTKYWIGFKDKKGSLFSLEHPENFLSEKSLERRSRQNIKLDETDLPVSKTYTDSLKKLGLTILNVSKWLNGAVVKSEDQLLLDTIENYGFITEKRLVFNPQNHKSRLQKWNDTFVNAENSTRSDYGFSWEQTSLCEGQYLHNMGYRGQGMLIAILDAGFYHIQTLPAFDNLWNGSRIVAIRNFVDDTLDIFQVHAHGMYVLSILGGTIPGSYIGSAPGASFILCRSEDVNSEFPIEEDNWVAAAEFADSMGADVINSSLGYYVFDDPALSHTYSDLDGLTTHVSIGAAMAAAKGILVSNSAGNEGNKTWHYIIAPADASDILAVGAVDSLGNKAAFSSFGPSSDDRIKPDVSAMGQATAIQGKNGNILRGSGTSFSSPVMAGLAACLWQAFPDITRGELIEAIEVSSTNYYTPDNSTGYGIPDFSLAYQFLKNSGASGNNIFFQVFPNPFNNEISILLFQEFNVPVKVELFNSLGEIVRNETFTTQNAGIFLTRLQNLNSLSSGVYIIRVTTGTKRTSKILIRQ